MSEGVSTMTDKPNCSTCPHNYIHHNSGMGTDRPRCSITKWFLDTTLFKDLDNDYFSRSCCPIHSNAREYLIKNVIKELERLSECNYGTDTGRKYAAVYVKVISLIRDGVKA